METVPVATILQLAEAGAAREWQFDLLSALIGAGAALLLSLLLWVLLAVLKQGWTAIKARLARLRRRVRTSAADRYRELALQWAQSVASPPSAPSLDRTFCEPDLLAPPLIPRSSTDVENAQTEPRLLSLRQALAGHPQLALLGKAGAGRTAIMAYMVLSNVSPPPQPAAEDEEENDQKEPEQAQQRLPLYVSLPEIEWNGPGEKGDLKDPVQRLAGAAVNAVGGSAKMATALRSALRSGQAIVLLDGWDEMNPRDQEAAIAWMAKLVASLPGNRWFASAGPRGFAPLVDIGFLPLTLAGWRTAKIEAFAGRWVECCETDEGPTIPPFELAAQLRHAARRGALPLELALRAFVALAGRRPPPARGALFGCVLELLLEEEGLEPEEAPELTAACRATLGRVALRLQQGGRSIARRNEIETEIEASLPPQEERSPRAASRVMDLLSGERGLLRPAGPDRYTFTHPLWQAYLVARQLLAGPPSDLLDRIADPRWTEVILFYVESGNAAPLVSAWLKAPDDLFHTRLCAFGAWLRAAPPDAAWRNGGMALLARTFLRQGQPQMVQEALARIMATTGLPGISAFLRQALQHPNPDLRTAALLGLAALPEDVDVSTFEGALSDEDPLVRETAVRGLAALETTAAQQSLEMILHEEEDSLRAVAAEELAGFGRENLELLRELVRADDMVARRAAVFGLHRAGERELLVRLARDDEQWAVRTAAAAAIEELDEHPFPVIEPPPRPEHMPWLVSWAASEGKGVGMGEAAEEILRLALEKGDSTVRLAAALVLAQAGGPDDVDLLRTVLTDPDPFTAGVALEALAEISRRHDLTIERRPS